MTEGQKIVKIRRNTEGDITNVMLEDGTVYPIDEAIRLTRDEIISGVNVSRSKSGREFLRANPDGNENNNLDNLPNF